MIMEYCELLHQNIPSLLEIQEWLMDVNLTIRASDFFQDWWAEVTHEAIKAPQALHNTPPLLGAPKVIL